MEGLPILLNPEPEGTVNGFWMPTVVVDPDVCFDRDALLAAFRRQEIDARVFFWPLSMLPMFEGSPKTNVSHGLYRRAMNLPTYHELSEIEMERVIALVHEFITSTVEE
jgi:perosamine synthetase